MSSPAGHRQPAHSHRRRYLGLSAGIGVAAILSVALYLHDIDWWYAPLGIVLLHLIPQLLMAAAATLFVGRRAADGSAIMRSPRLYDGLVSLLTLGRGTRMRRQTLALAELKVGDCVLDVGCGTGSLLCEAAAAVGPAGELHGIDAGEAMLAHAEAKAAARGVALELRQGSAAQLKYADDSFDAVFCTMVLHHLERGAQPAVLKEMRRVVRPGGRIVILELQPPLDRAGRLRTLFSLVGWLHGRPSSGPQSSIVDVEEELRALGCEIATRRQRGPMASIAAAVPT